MRIFVLYVYAYAPDVPAAAFHEGVEVLGDLLHDQGPLHVHRADVPIL